MHIEEIDISSIPSDPEEQIPHYNQVCSVTLDQYKKVHLCKCTYKLVNEHFLSVKIDPAFRKAREYVLNISLLDPVPFRSLRISWGYLTVFTFFSLAAVLTGSTNIFPDSGTWLVAVAGICAGLCLMLSIYSSHYCLVFYSQNGRIPLLTLLNQNPDSDTFSRFINMFTDHINKTRASLSLNSNNERLNAELREHRRLMENNIISRESYDIAKLRILDLHN